jgi:hypothetical protein
MRGNDELIYKGIVGRVQLAVGGGVFVFDQNWSTDLINEIQSFNNQFIGLRNKPANCQLKNCQLHDYPRNPIV